MEKKARPIEARRMRPDEWRTFKSLRLAALERDGDQFGQSYEVVSGYTDAKWEEDSRKAADSDEFCIVLAFDGREPVGMSGCVRADDFGKIIAVWVEPSHRGGGIGGLLVKATMEVAGSDRYKLTVVEDNRPAIRTYEKLGFVGTGFSYVNHKGFREIEMVRAPGNQRDGTA